MNFRTHHIETRTSPFGYYATCEAGCEYVSSAYAPTARDAWNMATDELPAMCQPVEDDPREWEPCRCGHPDCGAC